MKFLVSICMTLLFYSLQSHSMEMPPQDEQELRENQDPTKNSVLSDRGDDCINLDPSLNKAMNICSPLSSGANRMEMPWEDEVKLDQKHNNIFIPKMPFDYYSPHRTFVTILSPLVTVNKVFKSLIPSEWRDKYVATNNDNNFRTSDTAIIDNQKDFLIRLNEIGQDGNHIVLLTEDLVPKDEKLEQFFTSLFDAFKGNFPKSESPAYRQNFITLTVCGNQLNKEIITKRPKNMLIINGAISKIEAVLKTTVLEEDEEVKPFTIGFLKRKFNQGDVYIDVDPVYYPNFLWSSESHVFGEVHALDKKELDNKKGVYFVINGGELDGIKPNSKFRYFYSRYFYHPECEKTLSDPFTISSPSYFDNCRFCKPKRPCTHCKLYKKNAINPTSTHLSSAEILSVPENLQKKVGESPAVRIIICPEEDFATPRGNEANEYYKYEEDAINNYLKLLTDLQEKYEYVPAKIIINKDIKNAKKFDSFKDIASSDKNIIYSYKPGLELDVKKGETICIAINEPEFKFAYIAGMVDEKDRIIAQVFAKEKEIFAERPVQEDNDTDEENSASENDDAYTLLKLKNFPPPFSSGSNLKLVIFGATQKEAQAFSEWTPDKTFNLNVNSINSGLSKDRSSYRGGGHAEKKIQIYVLTIKLVN